MDKTAYYWTSNNSPKVDFIIQCETDIVPIEVKSEMNIKSRSPAEYRKKYEPKYSVIASMKNDIGEKEILRIPLYFISKIKSFFVNLIKS